MSSRPATLLPRPAAPLLLALLMLALAACRAEAPAHADKHGDDHGDEHGDEHAKKLADGHGDEPDGHGDEHGDEHGGEHGDEHGDEHDDGLHIEGLRGVSFAAAGPVRQESAWFAAEAVSDPSAETLLATPVAGQVVAFHAAPGAVLARGAAVVEILSPELAELEARWLAARARAERARRDAEREARLLEQGATAARELEAAQAEAAVAAADEQAAGAAIAARGAVPGSGKATVLVRALRAGTLAGFTVALGENVPAGARLGSLIAAGAELVRVELPLPGPDSWTFGATTEARRSDGRRWPLRVEGLPPRLAPDTRRLSYFLRLSGEQRPLAGTPLEVRVPLASAIVLPQTALQQIEGVWGVFLRRGDVATFQPVRKGAELGGDVLILEGVAPGDEVATEGAYLLKALQLKLAGGGDGHDH